MSTLRYWIWLTNLRSLSHQAAFHLLEHFGTPEGAYFADPAEYALIDGLSAPAQAALRDKSMDRAEIILAECDRLGIRILTLQDAEYPERLRQLTDPPPILYVKGKVFPFDEEPVIGVVGTRDATPYGLRMAGKLGLELARQGGLVVSGIARGVDSAALHGALRGGGSVVSVLGNGTDVIYPAQNRDLYADVAAAGALISEYPPGTEPNGRNFPIRNRIISGLSLGVVVVEGPETSGALITARLALDQNRDAFAVPGNADAPMSRGPNLLIRRGEAKLVTNGWDVLEDYAARYPGRIRHMPPLPAQAEEQRLASTAADAGVKEEADEDIFIHAHKKEVDKASDRTYIDLKDHGGEFTDDERDILFAIGGRAMVADDIIETTQIPAKRVFSALTMLQVRGLVEENPGRQFKALVLLKAE